MDVKEFFDRAKDICNDNLGACQECPLTYFCSDGIFAGTGKEIGELIEIVTKERDENEQ